MAKRSSTHRSGNAEGVSNCGVRTSSERGRSVVRPSTFRARLPKWAVRLALLAAVPLLLLLIEGGLRLFRYGHPTTFFIPADRQTLTTNPKFAWPFQPRASATSPTPLLLKKEKEAGTKRVFVLGESAAAGTPDPAFSFSRMLEVMLHEQVPTQKVEVLNVAMRGIDSYIIRKIAAECAELSPDLFIIYAGNNDLIGLHSADPIKPMFLVNRSFIRAQNAVRATRVAQLMESTLRLVRKNKPEPPQEMESVRSQRLALDDPRREPVYRSYAQNLEDICESAGRAGARTLLCTVAVNLHDFPPLESLHRRYLAPADLETWQKHYDAGTKAEWDRQFDKALAAFQAAARLDDHYAELLFHIARCEEALGKADEARKYFGLARDWDAVQFRTDSRLNDIIRETAARQQGVVKVVDIEKAFAASSLAASGVPGSALFQEHVHFFFEGDHLLATTLFPEVAATLGLSATGKAPLSKEECARLLAYTPVEAANILSAVAQMTGKPPFLDQLEHGPRQAAAERRAQDALQALTVAVGEDALAAYRSAIERRPDDWMLQYNYGRLLTDMGRHTASIPVYDHITKTFPHQRTFRLLYGMALLNAKRASDAVNEFSAALSIDPDFAPARQALAKAYASR